jgi:hypothetical protein
MIVTDETKEDEIYIGCMTVQMGLWNPSNVSEGCIVKHCGNCGIEIHLAPASQKFLAEKPKANLICIPCIQKQAIEKKAKGEPLKFSGAVPGAIEEALDHIDRQKREKE